jgi:hypothetical protein
MRLAASSAVPFARFLSFGEFNHRLFPAFVRSFVRFEIDLISSSVLVVVVVVVSYYRRRPTKAMTAVVVVLSLVLLDDRGRGGRATTTRDDAPLHSLTFPFPFVVCASLFLQFAREKRRRL